MTKHRFLLKLPKLTSHQIHDILQANAKRLGDCGVKSVGLFGSTVRNEQTPLSDIDLLLDFHPEMETFDNYMCAYDLLETLFAGMKLDVVTRNGLSPYIGPYILNEAQYVQKSR